VTRRFAIGLTSITLVLGFAHAASADWSTYHGDAARSGVDHSTASASTFAAGWTSSDLGGDIYGEPLISNGLVYVATESDDVYGLSTASGQVVWHQHVATAVPSSALPCGDISPTVGITSTPVLDAARNLIFVVADTWNGSSAAHVLFALRASDGTPVFSENVDAPGSDPKAQLQRPGLAISGGQVLIGFGGNDGDCSTYLGRMASASESGPATPSYWKVGASNGAGIWMGGAAPAVDGAGYVYATTGNTTGSPATYDHSNTIEKLTPQLAEADHFADPLWQSDSSSDTDLGSAAPQLLDGGLIFQAGKNSSHAYLVRSGAMNSAPAYDAAVCASYGADAYLSGTIFVACSGGIRAVSLNTVAPSFSLLWHGPSDANGPPIVAGGLVWVTAYNGAKLYGLDPSSGATRVAQSTPTMAHFATPAACDGKLYLATDHTVEQYTIGTAVSPAACAAAPMAPTPAPAARPACTTVTIRVRHPHRARIVRATILRGHRRLATSRGHNLKRVTVKALSGTYTLRLVERTARHGRLSYHLRFKGCARLR
jgi:polyvinyl alcohol dehydrogenase (cytochrome)